GVPRFRETLRFRRPRRCEEGRGDPQGRGSPPREQEPHCLLSKQPLVRLDARAARNFAGSFHVIVENGDSSIFARRIHNHLSHGEMAYVDGSSYNSPTREFYSWHG